MIFSVFDHNRRTWDYFEAPGTAADYGARGTKYRAPNQPPIGPAMGGLGPIGFVPEALAIALPQNARRIGSGSNARGVVAVMRQVGLSGAGVGAVESLEIVEGLGGLGADGFVALPTKAPAEPGEAIFVLKPTLGQTIAAACVAATVGVIVQRILSKK